MLCFASTSVNVFEVFVCDGFFWGLQKKVSTLKKDKNDLFFLNGLEWELARSWSRRWSVAFLLSPSSLI